VASIATEDSEALLGRVLADSSLALEVRRAALNALGRRGATDNSRKLLQEFVTNAAGDPLQDEGRKLLERAAR
jgi:hypothetical protein